MLKTLDVDEKDTAASFLKAYGWLSPRKLCIILNIIEESELLWIVLLNVLAP